MSVLRTLHVVGQVLAGTVGGAEDAAPPADPRVVREMLVDIGMVPVEGSDSDVHFALRRFQARSGLTPDGVAGAETAQALARYAREARHIRQLGLAA